MSVEQDKDREEIILMANQTYRAVYAPDGELAVAEDIATLGIQRLHRLGKYATSDADRAQIVELERALNGLFRIEDQRIETARYFLDLASGEA